MTRDLAAIARDYIVSTTYRREEQRGAKWRGEAVGRDVGSAFEARSSPIPEDVPAAIYEEYEGLRLPSPLAHIGATGDDGEVSASRVVSTVLELACTDFGLEPLNGASVHRATPSPAARHGILSFVVARRLGQVGSWQWRPEDGLLRPTLGSDCKALLGEEALLLVLVGDCSRHADLYGDFSPCLAALEGGFGAGQVGIGLSALGWGAGTVCDLPPGVVSAALGLDHWSLAPVAVLRLRGPQTSATLDDCAAAAAMVPTRPSKPHGLEEYTVAWEFLAAYLSETPSRRLEPTEVRPGRRRSWTFDLDAAITRRSSGFPFSGPGRPMLREDVTGFSDALRELERRAGLVDTAAAAMTTRLSLTGSGCEDDGEYALERWSGRLAALPSTPPRAYASSLGAAGELVVTIGCDDLAEGAVTPATFVRSHVAAGALGQRICLAAASRGMTARPLRSYSERTVDTLLELEQRTVMQILCRYERRANLRLPLRWR